MNNLECPLQVTTASNCFPNICSNAAASLASCEQLLLLLLLLQMLQSLFHCWQQLSEIVLGNKYAVANYVV